MPFSIGKCNLLRYLISTGEQANSMVCSRGAFFIKQTITINNGRQFPMWMRVKKNPGKMILCNVCVCVLLWWLALLCGVIRVGSKNYKLFAQRQTIVCCLHCRNYFINNTTVFMYKKRASNSFTIFVSLFSLREIDLMFRLPSTVRLRGTFIM